MTDQDATNATEQINRRAALKKGVVGAAVAGAVWNAPRIEGMTLRPNYASAGSGATTGSGTVGPNALPDLVNINIAIPTGGLACVITQVTLLLDITHSWIGDMEIRLTSPGGSTILLLEDECAGFSSGMLVTLADGSPPIGTSCATFYTGTFAPIEPLSTFNGQDPNGSWTLNIIDDQGQDDGVLNSATLFITAAAV